MTKFSDLPIYNFIGNEGITKILLDAFHDSKKREDEKGEIFKGNLLNEIL